MDDLKEFNAAQFSDSPVTAQKNKKNQPIPVPQISSRNIQNSDLYRTIAGDDIYTKQNTSVANPFASDYFNSKIWGIDLGKVTNEAEDRLNGINPYSRAADFEDIRRDAQSNISAGINLFNQYIGKTAINTVGGIIGGFYGIGSAIAQQDSSYLFDNSVTRTLDKGTEAIESGNTIFTSKRAQDNSALGLFSFETVKEVNDAFSFISGAIASELLTGGLISGTLLATAPGRLANATASLAGRTAARIEQGIGVGNGVRQTGNYASRIEEISRLLNSVDPNDIQRLQTIARETGSTIDDLAKYAKTFDNFNSSFKAGRSLIQGTFWEAGLEARQTKDDLILNQTNKLEGDMENMSFNSPEEKENYRKNQLEKITEVANKAGLSTFGINVGILGASNYIQFPTIFGLKPTVGVDGLRGAITRNSLREAVRAGGKASTIVKTIATALRSPATEFMEETLQGATHIASKSYYETQLGTRTNDGELNPGMASISDAIMTGLEETYGTQEGIHQGLIGAITGGIGGPSIGRNKNGKLRPRLEGGISQAINQNREYNLNINEAIAELNQNKFDTLLSYNKDNAIIASIDSKRQTIAELNEDKHEVQRMQDNKIFRSVKERLDKGLDSYIDQEVNEMKNMPLEQYKTSFEKPEDFTQQDKDTEINNFSNKVDIYRDAYKKVYKGLQMDRVNNNRMSKKYFDTITYAVANEKIYTQRQKELTEALLSNKNIEMNSEELLMAATLQDKFKDHQKTIDDLIKLKSLENNEKFDKKKSEKLDRLKSKIDKQYQWLLESPNLDDTTDLQRLRKLKDTFQTEEYKALAANAEIILENEQSLDQIIAEQEEFEKKREKLTKVNIGQFGKIRTLREATKSVAEAIQKSLDRTQSESLNILRNKKDTVTQIELENYLELKERLNNSIKQNNINNQHSFLDNLQPGYDDIQTAINELSNITKHQIDALNIATNLYGLDKTNKAYSNIARATFAENRNNLENQMHKGLDELATEQDADNITEIVSNLERSINNLQEDLDEFGDLITEDYKTEISTLLEDAREINNKLNTFLENQDKKEETKAETVKTNKKQEEDNQIDKILNKDEEDAKLEQELKYEEEGNVDDFDNENITLFNSRNLHTIKITNSTQPDSISLKDKINNGTIKCNSGAIINYNEENENSSGFKQYLEDLKIEESYASGKNKVINDPSLLDKDITELEPDVISFISHAPVNLDIYNKEVEISEGKQEFNIDEDEDVPEHSIMYFSPELNSNNKDLDKYNSIKEDLTNDYNNKINSLNDKLNSISEEKQKVIEKLDSLFKSLSKNNSEKDAERLALESLSPEEKSVLNKKENSNSVPQEEYNKQKSEIKRRRQEELKTELDKKAKGIPVKKEYYIDNNGNDITATTYRAGNKSFVFTENSTSAGDALEDLNIDNKIPYKTEEVTSKLEDKINAKYDAELAEVENKSQISTEEYNKQKSLIDRKYQIDLADLEAQYSLKLNNINDKVLFNFRQQLLSNNYNNGLNELKMRLGNIVDGRLEQLGDETFNVDEFGITGSNGNDNFLFESNDQIGPDNIFFGKTTGEYFDFNDNKIKINAGSKLDRNTASTGQIYIGYRTVNNKIVPIKMNRAKLGTNEKVFNEITYQLEQYFLNNMKQDMPVLIKDQSLNFLIGKSYEEFFTAFFDYNNTGNSYRRLDTLNIVKETSNKKPGVIYLGNLDLEIDSLDTFNSNKEQILKSISDMRFYMDKVSLKRKSDGSFNEEFKNFILDEKLLNHNFNTKNNSDRIFVKGTDKSIQFHVLNTQVNALNPARKNKTKQKEVIDNLDKLLGRKKNENLSRENIFYNLNADIISHATKLYKDSGNPEQSILSAFNEVLEEKLIEARKYAESFPQELKTDEKSLIDNNNIKLIESDGIIDTFVKMIYVYKNKFQTREETIKAFSVYLKNKNYAGNYKNILLDKKLDPVKMMLAEPIEIEENKDGKTVTKTKYKFNFSEALTENSPEENRDRFRNIINSFSQLDKTARKFMPLIYKNNDKDSSLSKVFIDFSKEFISNDGKKNENVYYHTTDDKGNVTKRSGLANGKFYNLVQFNYKNKKGEQVYNNAVEFKYLDSNNELVTTRTPDTDFKFDSNGELINGVIYITFNNDKGFAEQQPVLVGKENNIYSNNYIKTIKVPGLNQDFTYNKNSAEALEVLYNNFDSAIDNLNKETLGLFKNNKIIKDNLKLSRNSDTVLDEDSSLEDELRALEQRVNKPTATSNTSEPDVPKTVNDEIMQADLFSELNGGNFNEDDIYSNQDDEPSISDPEFDDEPSDSNSFTIEDLGRAENDSVSNLPGLSYSQQDTIENTSSMLSARLDRAIKADINEEEFITRFSNFGIDNYKKAIEMVNILNTNNVANRNKSITFVNKAFNKTKKDSDELSDCK